MTDAATPIVHCASLDEFAHLYSTEIQHGGVFVESSRPPTVFSDMAVRIVLPGDEEDLVLSGVVVSVLSERSGSTYDGREGYVIQFTEITNEQRRTMQELVAQSSHRAGKTAARAQGIASTGTVKPGNLTETSDAGGREGAWTDSDSSMVVQERLRNELEVLRTKDAYGILGLKSRAGWAEVRSAFLELTKRRHPDRYARYESAEIREIATDIFVLTKKAYGRIKAMSR